VSTMCAQDCKYAKKKVTALLIIGSTHTRLVFAVQLSLCFPARILCLLLELFCVSQTWGCTRHHNMAMLDTQLSDLCFVAEIRLSQLGAVQVLNLALGHHFMSP
jgi:hypothetical protein